MNGKLAAVAAMSAVAILLYWFPVPLVVGGYVLGGYPWLAPESSKTAIVVLGIVISTVFLVLTGLMWYISKKLEEAEEHSPARELGGYAVEGHSVEW